MDDIDRMVERLRRVEALFSRAGTPGEQVAAEKAMERIKERLAGFAASAPPEEFRFTIHDQWSRELFRAMLRRYDIKPYRYHGQRRTTILAKMTPKASDELWGEFCELDKVLHEYLNEVTNKVIAQAWSQAPEEDDERDVKELEA